MGLFNKTCTVCGAKKDLKRCPFCRNDVCANCLKPLVAKEKTPVWFIGKEVTSFKEYFELNKEYIREFKQKGGSAHCCEEYVKTAWQGIVSQVKKFEDEHDEQVVKKIILK
ncbi:hypothetical protein ACFL6I_07490 [candidate division KSB1 bacterium]